LISIEWLGQTARILLDHYFNEN